MLIFLNGVAFFFNSGELERYISELPAARNNNFFCYIRIIYQMTQYYAPEGNNVNTKSRTYILKKGTIDFGIYKAAFLVSLQLMFFMISLSLIQF
jgi:hypothetical protein